MHLDRKLLMPKLKAKPEQITITIDSEENDDWIKSLPGHQDEVAIHEQLAQKLKENDIISTLKSGKAIIS